MSGTLVDSNILIDIATDDPVWSAWSSDALEQAAETGPLFINPIIYAEVSVAYTRIEDLEATLPRDLFRREDLPWEAGFLAGKAFFAYRRRGGGASAPLPDFYIGAHAAIRDYALLTRDRRRYRIAFPTLTLITPVV